MSFLHGFDVLSLIETRFGIVFFGTPHLAGNLVALGKFVSHMIRTTTPGTASKEALQSLEQTGFVADELSEKFRGLVDDFWIVSFYENDLTKIGDQDLGRVCVQSSEKRAQLLMIFTTQIVEQQGLFSIMKSHEKSQELPGNHVSMCKFDSETIENWKLVEGLLVELAGNALKARQKAGVLLKTRPPFAKIEDISLFCMHDDGSRSHLWANQIS